MPRQKYDRVADDLREDGQAYATPVELLGRCEACGRQLQQHREGRSVRFCGPTCRQRHYRAARLF